MITILHHRSIGERIFDAFNIVFLLALSVLFIYPFWDLIVLSFTSPKYSDVLGLRLYPQEFTFAAYEALFNDNLMYTAYLNTIMRTVAGTFLILFTTFFAACALAKRSLPLRNLITLLILLTLFFNGGLIPTYLNIRNLGLMDTLWALILPGMANAWYIILMRNFLMSIPAELEESGMIDGANPLQIAVRIILPLSKPIIAVAGLWGAVHHWNSWFDAMIYTRSQENYVLQYLVQRIMMQEQMTSAGAGSLIEFTSATTSQSLKAATIVASILPIIFVYPFVQKYFVKGIMIGSLKG